VTTPLIQFLIGSTREGRIGPRVANWLFALAQQRTDFASALIDLKEWDLPMFNQAAKPSSGQYSPLQQRWADAIKPADGYVFITPEYNHGYPASLKNALDYLSAEWNYKPAAFVSYGGSSGGGRSVEQLRQVVIDLKLVPIASSIQIPFIEKAFDKSGQPVDERFQKKAQSFFDQVVWWATAMKQAREQIPLPAKRT